MATSKRITAPRNPGRVESVNLASYVPKSYREGTQGDWVNYGDDNLYPQYLVDLYHASPTHNALCTTIAMMVFGEGFEPADLNAKLLAAQWDLDSELRKCAIDLKIQNGFALEVNWSLDRSTIANISHLPFENVRSGFCDENEVVDWYYYSRDWMDKRQEPTAIARFNPETKNEYPTQILYMKPFSVGSYYYPKPDYIGAINYIELEKEISVFHINNIKNGLSPSFAIHFKNGIPSDEERRMIRRDIENQAAGAQNAGKFWMTFSDEPDRAPTIEPFALSDADKQYQFLSEETTAKIMIGHRVTNPQMFGVMVAGKLGGGSEMEASAELFDQQVVQPFRMILEDAVETLLNASGATPTLLSEQVNLDGAFQYLEACGEEIGEDWILIDEREVDYNCEEAHDALWNFARALRNNPSAKSSQDNDIVRVRYAYAPTTLSDSKSRDFCRRMIDSMKVYRKEDIVQAGRQAVNPGWGPEGAETYDIWLYKGGGSCRHFWMRQTYLKKDNGLISVNEAQRIIRSLPPEERKDNRLEENDRKVAQRPRDMKNRGFLKPRKFTTPR
jgi:hypothetical protein